MKVDIPTHYMNKHESIARNTWGNTWGNKRLASYYLDTDNTVVLTGSSIIIGKSTYIPMTQKKFDALVKLVGLYNACKVYKELCDAGRDTRNSNPDKLFT